MVEFRNKTPKKHRTVWKSYTMHAWYMIPIGGTFDGNLYLAADTASMVDVNDLHFFVEYDEGPPVENGLRACIGTRVLPDDYIAGTDIKVKLIVTGSATTGIYTYKVGVAQKTAGEALSNDTDTEYNTISATANYTNSLYRPLETLEATYDGSGLEPGDPLSIILLRDESVDNNRISYVQMVQIIYQGNSYDGVYDDRFTINTPVQFKPTTVEIKFNGIFGYEMASSGTLNGLTTHDAGLGVLSNTWYIRVFEDNKDDCFIVNFRLPNNYIDGEDIKVHFDWFSTAADGNAYYHLGIANTPIGSPYAADDDMQWTDGAAACPLTALERSVFEYTFNGSSFSAGDLITIAVIREGNNASDTNTGTIGVVGVFADVPIKTKGELV